MLPTNYSDEPPKVSTPLRGVTQFCTLRPLGRESYPWFVCFGSNAEVDWDRWHVRCSSDRYTVAALSEIPNQRSSKLLSVRYGTDSAMTPRCR
jgi:hypothetical protein